MLLCCHDLGMSWERLVTHLCCPHACAVYLHFQSGNAGKLVNVPQKKAAKKPLALAAAPPPKPTANVIAPPAPSRSVLPVIGLLCCLVLL